MLQGLRTRAKDPRETPHPLSRSSPFHTPWLGRLDLVPELCRPPPIAGGFRHRKSQCCRISCPLIFAAPRRTFLTNFRGQRPSGERGTSSTNVRRSTPAVLVAVAARKGRPVAVRPHHRLRLRRSTPHPPITSPSPETRRRAATADARDRRRRPLLLVSTHAQEVLQPITCCQVATGYSTRTNNA